MTKYIKKPGGVEKLTKTCPECGSIFVVEKGFSITGYGTEVCQKCGVYRALKNFNLSDEEIKKFQKEMFKDALKLI